VRRSLLRDHPPSPKVEESREAKPFTRPSTISQKIPLSALEQSASPAFDPARTTMEDELLGILRDEILDTTEPIAAESDLFEAGLDSMGIMQLILAIEDRFAVVIDPSELSRDNFATTTRIIKLIRSKQSHAG
jgi:acyl carrier protein